MSRLVVVGVLLAVSGSSYAGDSAWLLCRGLAEHGAGTDKEKTHIVASLLEHRNATGDGRDLAVTLIYGAHISRGDILGGPGGEVLGHSLTTKLTSDDGKHPVIFTGKTEVSSDMKTLKLTGSIDWDFGQDPKSKPVPFTAKLTCDELDNLAIGH